jgi:hypothetical protein
LDILICVDEATEWPLMALNRRATSSGRQFHNHFCPNCGSTLCWTLDIRPNDYGVATGAFNDPGFSIPTVSVWELSKYDG